MRPGRLAPITLLWLLSSCATVLQIPRPVITDRSPPPVHDAYSMIALPIAVRLSAVQDYLNAALPATFAGSGRVDVPVNLVVSTKVGVNYQYEFERGPVTFTVRGNVLSASARFSGTLHGAAADLGLFQAEVGIDGEVRVGGPLTVEDDWTLVSRLNVAGTVNRAELPVGFTILGQRVGTSISVRPQMQAALDAAKKTMSEAVNRAVRGIDLKEAVMPYWRSLAAPIRLARSPDIWLSVRPLAAAFSGLSSDGTTLKLGIGAVAQIALYVGTRPADSPLGALPRLTKPASWGAFHLWLPVSMEYAELARLVSPHIVGQPFAPFGKDGTELTVSQVQLWSAGGLIFVGLKVSAKRPDVRGWLYLQGKLEVHPSGVLAVRGLDFTVDTKSNLVNAADGLMHSTLTTWLSEAINGVLANEVGTKAEDSMRERLNALLQNVRLAEGITLRATVDTAQVVGVYGSDGALELDTQFTGTASVSVNALSF